MSEGSWLERFLVGFVSGVSRRPWTVLIVCVGLAAASVAAFVTRIEYFTRRSDLASPDKDYQKRWQAFVHEFGDEDDLVVVVRGGDRPRLTAAVDRITAALASRPDLFDRIFARADLSALRDRSLLYLPVDELHSIRENLDRMSPLLSAPLGPIAWRSLTLCNLLKQARERAGRIDPDSPLSASDEQYLGQLLATVRSATATLEDPAEYTNPWSSLVPAGPDHRSDLLDRPQYLGSEDGKLCFVLARPVKAVGSFTPAEAGVVGLRAILADIRTEYPDLEIGLTGLPALETDEMAASQRDSNLAGWLALAGTALLDGVVYRGFRYPMLTVSTLLVGTAWAMGWLTLTVGHLNILSAAFAVMIIGLGDYGVLWVTRYEQCRRAGDDPAAATTATAIQVGPSLLTAASATALAFFAMMLADFRAVAELGWIAGWGVMFCAVSCLTVLPALIRLTDRRGMLAPLALVGGDGDRRPVYAPDRREAVWLPALARRPRFVLACGLAMTAVAASYLGRVGYDHNLLEMQAQGLDSVRWERELIAATAGASWHACSVCATADDARALKARYEQIPEVGRVVEVASLIPLEQDRKLPVVQEISRRLKHLPAKDAGIEPLTPQARDVQKEAGLLLGALQPQAKRSKQSVLSELVAGLEKLRDHGQWAVPAVAVAHLRTFDRRMVADLIADLHRLRAVGTPRGIALADLPVPLRERYVGSTGRFLVEAYAKDDLWQIAPLEKFIEAVRRIDPEATGKPFGTLEGLRSMQNGFTRAGLYALLVIVAVLAIDFRSLTHTLIALIPLALGVVWLLGTMGFLGRDLNPANMIALPLIVGCGVDNGVHVLHDWRSRRKRAGYVLAAATGKGIAVSALTTVLGFGALMISSHRGMAGLGFVLALGVTTCMTAALVLLPAGLRLTSRSSENRRAAGRRIA
ncbi:MAG: MMPL family transporter [Gemmataceae bacterium]|nr:MMPL family transporter [Gemmataceae bacterium]